MSRPKYLSIFKYVDPVKFLNDAYSFWSAEKPDFTLSFWARSLGLRNSALLTEFLNGDRTIPARMVPKIAKSLKLAGTERKYFEALLGINRAKTATEQELWMSLAKGIYDSVAAELEAVEDLRLLEHPILSGILSLVERPDFRFEMRWVQRRLNIPVDSKSLRESFEYLLARGFLALDSAGRLCRIKRKTSAA